LIPHILRHGVEDPPERALAGLPLQTFNAFRLLRFCLGFRTIEEFRWDGKTAQLLNPPWILSHWFSSGFDEPGVTSARMDAALMARKDPDIGSPAWARRLHSGHYPDKGAYSICMHRFDARTVSQTEIQIQSQETTMIYTEGAPCAHGTRSFRMVMRQGDGQTES
jgi:hypothetical protein